MAEEGEIEHEHKHEPSEHESDVSVSDANGSFTEDTKEHLSTKIVPTVTQTTALEEKLLTLKDNDTNETFYDEMRKEYKKWESDKAKLLKCFSDFLECKSEEKIQQQQERSNKLKQGLGTFVYFMVLFGITGYYRLLKLLQATTG